MGITEGQSFSSIDVGFERNGLNIFTVPWGGRRRRSSTDRQDRCSRDRHIFEDHVPDSRRLIRILNFIKDALTAFGFLFAGLGGEVDCPSRQQFHGGFCVFGEAFAVGGDLTVLPKQSYIFANNSSCRTPDCRCSRMSVSRKSK